MSISLGAAGPAPAPVQDRFDGVRDYIRQEMARENIPSISVAVSQNGRIVWEEAFGWADKEARVPATPDTIYSVASISKPFTATALMVLRKAGKVDLNRPANDYLGDAKLTARVGDAEGATLLRLSNHTAGLSRYWNFYDLDRDGGPPPMDETISRYGFLTYAPGTQYVYSNLDYGFLGYIVSRASRQSFADYARANVFAPLGLSHTSFSPDPDLKRFVAARYDRQGVRIAPYEVDYPGGAGAYTSAHDLIRFAMFHLKDHLPDQRAILSDGEIDEMQRPATATPASARDSGIGWALEPRRGLVEHGGYMPGVSAMVRLVPAADLAIVVLTNSNQDDLQTAERQIEDRTLQVVAPNIPPAFTEAPQAPLQPRTAFAAPAGLVGTWRGFVHTYKADIPLELVFLPSGSVARAKFGDEPWTEVSDPGLAPTEDGAGWVLDGEMRGDLGTADVDRLHPYILRLHLTIKADSMSGTARPYYFETTASGFYLPHWVALRRSS